MEWARRNWPSEPSSPLENKNNVVRREAILSRFWNTEDDYFASRSLDVFINKLRKVLADEPKINLKTVRGIGLQLLVEA